MKKAIYRIWQFVMRIAAYFLPWREPVLLEGEGSLRRLPEYIKSKNISSVLLVTDKTIMSLGLPKPLFEELENEQVRYVVYDEVVPNPTIDNIEAALALYRENGCGGVIAFGGGSPMDCAKATAARAAKPRQAVQKMRGMLKILKKLPPVFAIPTTAGTGSETTLAAVVTDSRTHHKYAINDPALIPHAAVLDPTLTVGLPPHITSTTGMDALCHAVEAYIGGANTKKTRRCAREATTLIFENLFDAYTDGKNMTARKNMQKAAYLAGLAFTRGYVGYVHAIAHSLGGFYQIPHGLANAVIMPYVFKAFGDSVWKRLAELSDLVGLSCEGDTLQQKSDKFIAAIEDFNSRMNIPDGFSQIREEDIPTLSGFADAESNPHYPVPRILSKQQLADIYRQLKR